MIDGLILISFYIVGTIVLLVVSSVIAEVWDVLKVLARRHKIMERMR